MGTFLAFVATGLTAWALLLWWGMIQEVALEGRRARVFWMIGTAAILGIAALSEGTGLFAGLLAGANILVGGGFLGLVLLAPQSTQAPAIAVGQPLPDFRAPDENGATFEISSLRGHPILLKFFRGHW